MITQEEFRSRYEAELPLYGAWGRMVTSEISRRVTSILAPDTALSQFLKVPAAPRTKTVASLIGKAYLRGKGYADPYSQITDKVGTRFVVLLVPDVELVKVAVEACPLWTYSKDRDYEEDRLNNPLLFEYQSVHYVVQATGGVSDGEFSFPDGLPCEVQIRTLMQHAFAELTHDAIYKATRKVPPELIREVAKSMALIETTDGIFAQVSMSLRSASRLLDDAIGRLAGIYARVVGASPETDQQANRFVLDELKDLWEESDIEDLERYIYAELPSVKRWVNEKAPLSYLFKQPAVLLIYYLANKARYDLRKSWPLLERELEPIYADLGY